MGGSPVAVAQQPDVLDVEDVAVGGGPRQQGGLPAGGGGGAPGHPQQHPQVPQGELLGKAGKEALGGHFPVQVGQLSPLFTSLRGLANICQTSQTNRNG